MIFCSTLHTQVTADEIRLCTFSRPQRFFFCRGGRPREKGGGLSELSSRCLVGPLKVVFASLFWRREIYFGFDIGDCIQTPGSSVERSCCVSWWAVICCPRCAIFEVGVVLFGRRVAAAWNAAKLSLRRASNHLTLASLRGFSLSFNSSFAGKMKKCIPTTTNKKTHTQRFWKVCTLEAKSNVPRATNITDV